MRQGIPHVVAYHDYMAALGTRDYYRIELVRDVAQLFLNDPYKQEAAAQRSHKQRITTISKDAYFRS